MRARTTDRTNAIRQRRYVDRLKKDRDDKIRLERENAWLLMQIDTLQKKVAKLKKAHDELAQGQSAAGFA